MHLNPPNHQKTSHWLKRSDSSDTQQPQGGAKNKLLNVAAMNEVHIIYSYQAINVLNHRWQNS